jgi:hypothetical protein
MSSPLGIVFAMDIDGIPTLRPPKTSGANVRAVARWSGWGVVEDFEDKDISGGFAGGTYHMRLMRIKSTGLIASERARE